MSAVESQLMIVSGVGLVGGLAVLVRGLGGYRSATRIADTATSRITALAAGEVRISGVVEAAEVLLTAPLTSKSCVYYDADVREQRGRYVTAVFQESRAVGFRLRDASGAIRVFPGGARWDIPRQLDGHTSLFGEAPAGLNLRMGPAIEVAELGRNEAIQQLLTVHQPDGGGTASRLLSDSHSGPRVYRESTLSPGDAITIVGFVEPFDQLPDPMLADDVAGDGTGTGPGIDPAIVADLTEARASGNLAPDARSAWGNAGIPGFGIGHPVRPPHLDPGALAEPLADAATAERIERTFTIPPETLVVAATADVPLFISYGVPDVAVARQGTRFYLGLLGAILAIVSALCLAVLVTGVV